MIDDSDKVWDKASKSKNKPISTQPIPTPPGPPLPIHNKGKAGNGDTIKWENEKEVTIDDKELNSSIPTLQIVLFI